MPDEIEREPLAQHQRGVKVTEEMTGVKLDVESCAICTRVRGLGGHHITFRSKGGEDGPQMPICVDCHNRIHDREWTVELLENGMMLNDREGQPIWRLMAWPLPGDAGEFVQLLDRVTEATKLMPEIAPALLPWQAVEVFRALREVGEGGWRAQTRLIGEMYQWRMPGWTSPDRVEALSTLFGLRRSQLYNHLQVAEAFSGNDVLEQTELSMGYAIEAARTSEPAAWLKRAEEQKLQHPSYSRDDLKAEIVRAGARKSAPDEAPAPSPTVWSKCAKCGAVGFNEKLPVGSDGTPVDVEEYK
jgi:hypothetical protein